MGLLILTQAMDAGDPVLGFFCRWAEEFSKRCERVYVVCLKEDKHSTRQNLSVYSLGKEVGRSRIKYILRFYRYVWALRKDYDSVFVHMNQEYVLLGGLLWFIFGKRIVLWRNHKMGSIWTRLAGAMVHTVCYTSPEAYVSKFKNAVQMPIGIDTDFFVPSGRAEPNSILFLGRLDPVKKPEVFVDALKQLNDEKIAFRADIYGDPTNPNLSHVDKLKKQMQPLIATGVLSLHPGIPNDKTLAIYASHEIYVNLTPSGSFDKTIGEAMACRRVVVVANEVLKEVLPQELLVDHRSSVSVASALHKALFMSAQQKAAITEKSRKYIEDEHSLSTLVTRVLKIFQ